MTPEVILKRPLLIFTLSLMAGILTGWLSGGYLAAGISIFVLSVLLFIICQKLKKYSFVFVIVILLFSFGSLEYIFLNNGNMNKFVDFAGKEISATGYIDAEPDIQPFNVVYTLKTESISIPDATKKIDGRILITTLRNKDTYIYRYGTKLEIKGQLNLPMGVRNPGGFDYRFYLAKSGISATVFATDSNIRYIDSSNTNLLVRLGQKVRDRVVNVINASLGKEQAGLLNGMLIGYREGLSKDVKESFSDAGLTHIMAVSGMNIAFIVLPLIFLFKKMRFKKRLANSIIIFILVFFVFVTGFSPSVVRAVIMAIIILIGQMLRRETDVFTSLAFAAFLLLLYNPYTLFDIGFQLSFAATLSLILFYKRIKELLSFRLMPEIVSDTLAVTLAAQVGVAPLIVFYFNNLSIISIISNLIVVPFVQIVTILGFAMAIFGQFGILISKLIGYVNNVFLTFILFITKSTADFPYAVLRIITPPAILIAVYYMLIIYFLWAKHQFKIKLKLRYYSIILAVFVLLTGISLYHPKQLEVVFIDVGQGDSTFVRTETGKTILIDGGGYRSMTNPDASIGESVLIPFLLDYGVSKLDTVIATHGHDDHMLGLLPVLEKLDVGSVIIPETEDKKEFKSLLDITEARNINVSSCSAGDRIRIDDKTFFNVIYPDIMQSSSESSSNEHSLVLKLCYENIAMLFTGDIDAGIENTLLEGEADIKAEVLKVAHHGSHYSTVQAFLDKVKPKAAIISVGKNNFGHPSEKVLVRLKEAKAKVFRTDECGAVILTTDGENIKIKSTVKE